MQPIEIEPNPKLVEYYHQSRTLHCDFDGSFQEFLANDEWHYILSNIEANIFLLRRLDEIGLLKQEVSVCDVGIGLATALFDLYLQSLEFQEKKFKFSGVEKHTKYINFLKQNLIHHWEDKLTIHECDIMDFNYSEFDILYSFCPFKTPEKLNDFYSKIITEMKPGAILIENRELGLGLNKILDNYCELEKIDLAGQWIFVKK